METRDFQLRVKTLDDTGAFTGYASTYGNVDLLGDICEAGCFKQAIQQQGRGFPLLWSHMQSEPIGLARISDSKEGLMVDGSLLLSDPAGQRAYGHLKLGSVRGLSIGFDVPKGEGKAVYQKDGTRLLREVRLHEVSLVAVPANPRAQVVSVKSLGDVRQVLRALREGDIDDDALSELKDINLELKRLLVDSDSEAQTADALREVKALAGELARLAA
jgi:HK97 family phage prohead protease